MMHVVCLVSVGDLTHDRLRVMFYTGRVKYSTETGTSTSLMNLYIYHHVSIDLLAAIEMVIWTRDRKGIHVNLEGNGAEAQAGDIFQIVKDYRRIPDAYNDVFSVWMVSPLLGSKVFI